MIIFFVFVKTDENGNICTLNFWVFFLKFPKSRKKMLKWLRDSWKFICIDKEDSTISHTWEKSKMFITESKYFSFFNNKPPASWVVHRTRDVLTCYSCSHYSSMLLWSSLSNNWGSYILLVKFVVNRMLIESICECKYVKNVVENFIRYAICLVVFLRKLKEIEQILSTLRLRI